MDVLEWLVNHRTECTYTYVAETSTKPMAQGTYVRMPALVGSQYVRTYVHVRSLCGVRTVQLYTFPLVGYVCMCIVCSRVHKIMFTVWILVHNCVGLCSQKPHNHWSSADPV